MKDNGTDRDVAMQILSGLDTCATLVAAVNDNLYVPHIVTQPVDFELTPPGDASFTVVARNAASYQWQYKTPNANWRDSSYESATTATLEFSITSSEDVRFTYNYRCAITGKDGSVIYTNEVQPVLEAEG